MVSELHLEILSSVYYFHTEYLVLLDLAEAPNIIYSTLPNRLKFQQKPIKKILTVRSYCRVGCIGLVSCISTTHADITGNITFLFKI